MKWQPKQYNAFKEERFAPLNDLLTALPNNDFVTIFDLGCGTGVATKPLLNKFPNARLVGVDSDKAMLDIAIAENPEATFIHIDVEGWLAEKTKSGHSADKNTLLFSNAALHWLDHHQTLLPKLMAVLGEGSSIAIQMPNNWQEPSHLELLALAKCPPWKEQLAPLLRENPVLSVAEYIDILTPKAKDVKVWEATFEHHLNGEDAVLNWLKGSSLKYYLDGLDVEQKPLFSKRLAEKLRAAYPVDEKGNVVFPFKRLFITGAK